VRRRAWPPARRSAPYRPIVGAYAPLVVACPDSGLTVTRLYGCPSEMRASTHNHGGNAATIDTGS
jgi:hypothetical protein